MIKTLKSENFDKIWSHNFLSKKAVKSFTFIKGIHFYKNSILPLYINVGRRLTQGNSYELLHGREKENFHAVHLIYDVPRFPTLRRLNKGENSTKVLNSFQYEAYAVDLRMFKTIEECLADILSGNYRYQIRKAVKRLNQSFKIETKSFSGPSYSNEYENLIEKFFTLFDRRYKIKKEQHVFLKKENKKFFADVLTPLLNNKEAVFFGIYADDELISLNLNYISENSMILVLPLYDPDYSRFKVGHISTYYSLKWCIEQGIHYYDFSKGHYPYKEQWSNISYGFDYHLIYNQKSLFSSFLAYSLYFSFQLKNKLRLIGFDHLIMRIKSLNKSPAISQLPHFELEICGAIPETPRRLLSRKEIGQIAGLTKIKNRFLFDYQENNSKTKCFKLSDGKILIQGVKNNLLLTPNTSGNS